MPTFKEKWTLAVSAETPAPSISSDGKDTKKVTPWMPDFAAFAQYEWARGQHVRLAGIVRTLSYRDMISETNHDKLGCTQGSAVGHPLPQITTYLTANYGHGYQSLGGDLLIGSYDLVGDPSVAGRLYAPASYGWCVGVQYNFTPSLFVSASASQTRYLPSEKVSGDEYKYGIFSDINIFWNLTPRIQLAAEFDLGMRKNFSGESAWARRFGAMAQFSF